MKTKIIFGDEHLINCGHEQADAYGFDYKNECNCFNDEEFKQYFIKKYPNHLASIAELDKEIKEIYG